MTEYRYRVYIIDLSKVVLHSKKFMARNPHYVEGKPCVYVGKTGKPVEERFREHKSGYKANKFARRHGKRLRLGDMRSIRPRRTSASIKRKECEVATALQEKGWGVWWMDFPQFR
jgi:hypothetical protein